MKTQYCIWTKETAESIARLAAQILDSGGLVAIPTETVYGLACRAEPQAIRRLDEIKARTEGKRYSLHVGKPEDIYRYIPEMPLRVRALIRKGLPGPITLVFRQNEANLHQLCRKLGDTIINILYEEGSIGIRCPDNEPASTILSGAVWPIVAPSANPSGQIPATSARQVLDYFDGHIEMAVDGGTGACRYQKSSTVVDISTNNIAILREGALTQHQIQDLATARIMFVCTGNTCRSPMAQVIAANYLSKKLACTVDELEGFGYIIESFGVSAYDGCQASGQAVKVMQEKGLSLAHHRSRLLTQMDVRQADLIFVLGRHHRDAILALDKTVADRVILLDSRGDIPDPIGLGEREYRECAERIETAVQERLKELS